MKLATVFCSVLLTAASAVPALAVDSFFDVFTEDPVFGPPYPTATIVTVVGENFPGGVQPSGQVRIAIGDLTRDGVPDIAAHAQGSDGSPPGSYAIDSFFDVFYDLAANPPVHSFFDVFCEVTLPDGSPTQLLPMNSALPPSDPARFFDIFYGDDFFDITYRTSSPGGRYHEWRWRTSCQAPMSFFDVFVDFHSQGSIDSFFDVFVDLELTGPGLPDMSQPMLRIHSTGTSEFGPVPTVDATWSRIKNLY